MPHSLQLFSYILSAEVVSSRKGSTEDKIAAARARLAVRRRNRNDLIAAATQNALPLKNPDISVVAALSSSGKPSKTLVSSTTQLASESVIDASSPVKGAEHLVCGQKCVPDVGNVPVVEESCVSSDEFPSKALEVGPDTDPTDLEILLSAVTAKERVNEAIVQLFCVHGTRVECQQECLGDCSFLNACFHVATCKYVYCEIDATDLTTAEAREAAGAYNRGQLRPDSLDKGKGDFSVEKTPPATARVPLYPPQ
ncbi:hypothetical protein EmuJ_001112100 [Echinococcus multilocularis]|uniref:Uncharacterized protein n=1 Tax=Echinococcus multilocularis TaxID=6211 RepID=A0A068YF00_ECHMU|nr:hypothetical protein EmuJ_001112100 [Echinococcus multilocularis]